MGAKLLRILRQGKGKRHGIDGSITANFNSRNNVICQEGLIRGFLPDSSFLQDSRPLLAAAHNLGNGQFILTFQHIKALLLGIAEILRQL